MADYTELLQVMKRAALEAVAAGQPVALCYGTVRSVEPLQIMADQKLPLEAEQLELLSAVRGGLQVGEKVLLLRWQGGQKYLVLDRVSEAGAGANERGVVM